MAAPVYVTNDVPTADEVNDWFVNVGYARKTVTESVTSSTTLQDDDVLVLPVESTSVYEIMLQIFYDGATAGDIKIGFTIPASASFDRIEVGYLTTAALAGDDQTLYSASVGTPTFGALGTGSTAPLLITGTLIVAGTAGNIRFQFAQGTSSGTATRVFAPSSIRAHRVS